jgi:hypothetical protein
VASEDAEDHGERVRRHVYDVGFSGSPDAGRTTAQLVLETDLPSHARIFVNCYVSVIGPVWVSPDILSLGRLPAGEAFEKTITVRHREGGPLRILDTRAEGPEALGLSVSPGDPDPRMPGSTRFVVEGTANRPAGAQPGSISRVEGVIVLSTSLADQPEVRITFNGWIVPEP